MVILHFTMVLTYLTSKTITQADLVYKNKVMKNACNNRAHGDVFKFCHNPFATIQHRKALNCHI